MYSTCIHAAHHSNLVSYFTFAISVLGLVSVHFSYAVNRECFILSQRFADHVVFLPLELPFASAVVVNSGMGIWFCLRLSQSLVWAVCVCVFRDGPFHNTHVLTNMEFV